MESSGVVCNATPTPRRGKNKDHRPDLKQLLYNLTVTADGAAPIVFGVENGNVTDDKTHQSTWDLVCRIVGSSDFLYVADSKLATRGNMSYIVNRGGRFLSVLPRSGAEDREFRRRVLREGGARSSPEKPPDPSSRVGAWFAALEAGLAADEISSG